MPRAVICVSHTISMGHRLPSYDGICSSPHGHNVTFDVEVEADAFLDFKHVSDVLRGIVDDFDHAMVLSLYDPFGEILGREFPEFRLVLLTVEPTTEAIAQYVFNCMRDNFSGTLRVIVHETSKYAASIEAASPVGQVARVR
jgi:6-pyruvoyl-tetrahydropterin synthase